MPTGTRVMMWANYRRGPSLSVPSPHDGDATTPWWYDRIAELASEWAEAGFTDVLFPSPLKTNAGAFEGADGYGVFDDYDIGSKNTTEFGGIPTRFGYADQLRRAIAICHRNGLAVHVDHVMHQRMGGHNGRYVYLGADGKTLCGRFPKDQGCFRQWVGEDPVPDVPDDFSFGDELSPVDSKPAGYVHDALIDAGDWLFRTLGIQGARLDDMKGMAVSFIKDFVTSKAMAGKFFFGEYASGNRDDTDWWVSQVDGLCSAIDFDWHYNMAQPMCNGAGTGRFWMGALAGRGMIATNPMKAVPFVESMDSDTNGFATIVDNKELAEALMLAGEGLPLVYVRDYLPEADCYGLKPAIDNLVWCARMLANGSTVPRHGDAKVFVAERTGAPGLLFALNNDVWNPAWHHVTVQTDFGPHVQLHDYTGKNGADVWTDGAGRVTIGVPPGADGRGYGMWSRAGLDGPVPRKTLPTIQTFFGAADLDTPPATNGFSYGGQFWPDVGTDVHVRVTWPEPLTAGQSVKLRVLGPDDLALPDVNGVFRTKATGWHVVELECVGMPAAGRSFEVEVTYAAPERFKT